MRTDPRKGESVVSGGAKGWNTCRYEERPGPMYESYFLRANHPEKDQAFWIRYTLFHSRSSELAPEAELWVALFKDGKAIFGGHERLPMAESSWSPHDLDVTDFYYLHRTLFAVT